MQWFNFKPCQMLVLSSQDRVRWFCARGVLPDTAKVQTLKEAEQPTSAEEVRSFLGMANYSARFIKNFFTFQPLYMSLRADAHKNRAKSKKLWPEFKMHPTLVLSL